MAHKVWRAFKVDLGIIGKEFTAAILTGPGRPRTAVSNRFGKWAVEEDVYLADLIQPEIRHIEWTVKEIDPKTVELPAELLEQLA